MDLTSAESKATYAQIKEYVQNKFQLKVSTLYIAQIKRKCGIELREHYNKSKKEKQIIPQCTPEKEEAITDALRHFKMIEQKGMTAYDSQHLRHSCSVQEQLLFLSYKVSVREQAQYKD